MALLSNIGFSSCITSFIIFLILTMAFHLGKEKSISLISGFNSFTPQEQAEYDINRIVRDYRNLMAIFSADMLAGTFLSLISGYFALAAFAVLIVLIAKDFHMFPENAFAKYKIKNDNKE